MSEKTRRIVAALVVVLIILFCVWLLISKSPVFSVKKMFDYAVFQLVNISGLSIWLVRGVVLLLLIPFYWAIMEASSLSIFLFKRRGHYKKLAKILLLVYTAVFFLTMFFLGRDNYFGHTTGQVLKWYAETPEGLKFYDTPGFDPKYGIKLNPVTPEVILAYKQRDLGMIPKRIYPQSADFEYFDSLSGKPKVWYYLNSDGNYELFDRPGFHPTNQTQLKPVPSDIVSQIKNQDIHLQAERSERDLTLRKQQETEKTRKEIDAFVSLLNRNVPFASNKINVALAINISKADSNVSPENIFSNFLKQGKLNVMPDYFKRGFKTSGYFRQILGGNTDLLKQAGVLSRMDYLIIGDIDCSFKKNSEIEKDLISCNIIFNYKLISKKGDIVRSDTVNAIGTDFSEDGALKRGIELLIENNSERIFEKVT